MMKRTCNDCKALAWNGKCYLNHKNKSKTEFHHLTLEWKPSEPCPKPKTNTDFIYLLNRNSGGN